MNLEFRKTPNPLVRQVIPGGVVSPGRSQHIKKDSPQGADLLAASWDPLSGERFLQELLGLPSVTEVFIGYDFFTLHQAEDKGWEDLEEALLPLVEAYSFPLAFGQAEEAAQEETPPESLSNFSSEDLSPQDQRDIHQEITQLFEDRIQPAVAMDGGQILFKRFDQGIVYVEMHGACSGCPQSSVTLKEGIQRLLQHYVPEVMAVHIEGDAQEPAPEKGDVLIPGEDSQGSP